MCIYNNLIRLNVQKTEIIIFSHTDRSKVFHDSLCPWSGKLQQQVNKIGSSFLFCEFTISAHAQMGCGLALKRPATAPVPSTVKVISGLLMAEDIPSTETVNTP